MRSKKKTTTPTTTSSPDDPPEGVAVAFSLGANLVVGGPGGFDALAGCLAQALRDLAALLGPLEIASLYRTAPVSPIPQPDYLNTAARGFATLLPLDLLEFTQRLERQAGRTAEGPRWGPRPLDIDLLVYGDLLLETPRLTLPHPRLSQRRFVLAPLAEIAPELNIPGLSAPVSELLAQLEDNYAVERVAGRGWEEGGRDAEPGLS